MHFGTFSVNNTTWSLGFTHINYYFHVLTDQNTCTHTFTLHLWALLSLDIPKGDWGGQMSFISSLDMFNLMKQIVFLRLQGAAGERRLLAQTETTCIYGTADSQTVLCVFKCWTTSDLQQQMKMKGDEESVWEACLEWWYDLHWPSEGMLRWKKREKLIGETEHLC